MGTYSAAWKLFSTSGSITETVNGKDAWLKEILNDDTTESGTVVYTIPISSWISLDGNPALAFEGLPAGLEFTSMSIAPSDAGPFFTIPPSAGSMGRGASSDAGSSVSTWGVHGPFTENLTAISPSFQNIHGLSVSSSLKVIDWLSSLQFALSTTLGTGFVYAYVYKNLKSTGNYDIYNTVTNDSGSISTGHKTTLSAPSLLDQIQTLTIANSGGVVSNPAITSQSPTSLSFTWPALSTGNYLVLGTEFSGRQYVLGPFIYVLADPSGIYQIIPGQTHDTTYVDHLTTTQNVAIPTPFIKTGFIDGQ
jgi:hypothetical protein